MQAGRGWGRVSGRKPKHRGLKGVWSDMVDAFLERDKGAWLAASVDSVETTMG